MASTAMSAGCWRDGIIVTNLFVVNGERVGLVVAMCLPRFFGFWMNVVLLCSVYCMVSFA